MLFRSADLPPHITTKEKARTYIIAATGHGTLNNHDIHSIKKATIMETNVVDTIDVEELLRKRQGLFND